ncbi:MAG TPA: hypothetical protein VKE22_11325 [Haliangiales bacterium]|nr:hypothetical protein [Haliangiales bacterium]
MFEWVVVRSEHRGIVGTALPRAWRGEAAVAELTFGATRVTFIVPAAASPRRAARWPDVVVDWVDINEERLFPTDLASVLGEELSGLGAEVLATFSELDLRKATTGWYRKGALAELEHVGAAQVSWTPEDGLGRPFDGTRRSMGAQVGRRIAELVGDERSANLMDRLDGQRLAVGEAILETAFLRMLGQTPPKMDELRGQVATAPAQRLRLG